MKQRYFIRLSYNGARFFGWQRQKHVPTVQQALEETLSLQLRQDIHVQGCGRTDTGVHARDYYAHFDYTTEPLPEELVFRLNQMLPRDVAVQEVFPVQPKAHARFSATHRSYEYLVTPKKDPFRIGLATYYRHALDVEKMNAAAALLPQFQDFKAFSKTGSDAKSTLCEVTEAHWRRDGEGYVFRISANRFLRTMVRLLAGTLVDVGRGKLSVEEFKTVVESQRRGQGGMAFPPDGLYLVDIKYPDWVLKERATDGASA